MADHAAKAGLLFGDTTYDFLRRVVEFILPGLSACYFTIANIWGLPFAEEVSGTLAAIAVLGGVILAMSRKVYNGTDAQYDGVVEIDVDGALNRLVVDHTLEGLQERSALTLKVNKPSE